MHGLVTLHVGNQSAKGMNKLWKRKIGESMSAHGSAGVPTYRQEKIERLFRKHLAFKAKVHCLFADGRLYGGSK
jgi:hypothetical protein